jgi:hypothetical protein
MLNWNEEEFKKLHDPEFMFIRQTELITLDEWGICKKREGT